MDHRQAPKSYPNANANAGQRDRTGSVNFMRGFIHKQLENRAGKKNNNNSGEEDENPATSAFA